MKQSTKRLFSMVLALMLLVSALIVFFEFTQPTYTDIQAIKSEQFTRQQFVDSQRSAIKKVQKLIDAYRDDAELKDAQTAVQVSFPIDPDVPSAIAQLSGLVDLNNLALESIGISELISKNQKSSSDDKTSSNLSANFVKPVNKLIFDLNLSGTYDDLKNFLKNLETNVRIFDVGDITISHFGKASLNLYRYNVKVVAYYQGRQ